MVVDGYGDEPAHFADRHTGPSPGIMVWGGIMFDHRTPLVLVDGSLTTDRYVTQVVEPVVLSLLQGTPNTVFQQHGIPGRMSHGELLTD